jgi:hypothetical protein
MVAPTRRPRTNDAGEQARRGCTHFTILHQPETELMNRWRNTQEEWEERKSPASATLNIPERWIMPQGTSHIFG